MGKPYKLSVTPTSKWTGYECSTSTTTSPDNSFTDILNQKLTSLDARHKAIARMQPGTLVTLVAENKTLRESVQKLTKGMTQFSRDTRKMKETILDIQARSMQDNLVFSGLPEHTEKHTEATVSPLCEISSTKSSRS
ncbi:hypothetical protein ATANTOWER_028766 [Ataeniobius toweri]|uniref:Uncharacterized protein n=1 Tax=Ataeniobius toweri TaxID=208326 RepID=A0ABU7C4L0_9TELE|nr:hypothetical protein [Ataeniobius toweri]